MYELVGGEPGTSGESSESWFLILLGFCAVLSGFIMSFSWAVYLNPDLNPETRSLLNYIELGLSTPVILGVGFPYFRTAAREAFQVRLSMASLIALGTLTAYSYSAYLTIHHAAHVYYDSATMVIVLVTVGRFLQARARARAAQAMRTIAAETPQEARRLRGPEEEMVPADAILPGDLIRVLPAEKIAVDGRVREGRTTVDESLLTGESVPVARGPGEPVFQGTINLDGTILFEATQVGEGTLQVQIERLLADAIGARMPLEGLVDRVSAVFVASTLLLAAGVAFYYAAHHRPADALLNALSVLVVACPCALGLATPLAAFVALQRAAREGVLIRFPEALEKMSRVNAIVFDKTGTLTEGQLRVESIQAGATAGTGSEELLRIAASLASCSEHHASRAIQAAFQNLSGVTLSVEDFVNHPGEGVEGIVLASNGNGSRKDLHVFLGAASSFERRGMRFPADLEDTVPGSGYETRVYVGWDGVVQGVIRLQDHLRSAARETVDLCRQQHLEVHVLSGDRMETTARVAESLGIAHWAGKKLPWQKVEYVEELQRQGKRVAMVGDGVNDAPALARADVGFAHQTGTDLSKEAADVHVLGGDLARVPWTLTLARKTFRHIQQNLFWAFFYNVIAMGMAAAGWLRPIMAAAAMLLSSLMVVGNSLRLGKIMGLRPRAAQPAAPKASCTDSAEIPSAPVTAPDYSGTPRVDPASTS